MGDPQFSLITCTLGRKDTTGRLLHSLCAQNYRGGFELILVDQSPVGHLDPLLEDFTSRLPLLHVRCDTGLSRARNVGLRHARGALLCFPDDDCWYPPDVLADLARRLSETADLDLILGRTIDQCGRDSAGSFRRRGGAVSKWNVWSSGNSNALMIRRDIALAIGGFDETLGLGAPTPFQSGEETDFVLRALDVGARAVYDPDFKVYHAQVDSIIDDKTLKRARCYSPGFGRVLRKHRYGIAYVLYRVVRSLASAALAAAQFDRARARYKTVWAAGTLKGYLAGG